ncbi:spore coat protein CotH [Ruminococcus albus SY3]|uniref:Spore coat protein CotH n=1 Tax=Ruminococcus albus SY3 TaxID=1341156 RepID=A0A011VRC5_RUMAL|nr:CotH kinase family protein [Ruminococcus albus]EXM37831.1 spore coat protein CotH [Ruminococcus albus SY3]
MDIRKNIALLTALVCVLSVSSCSNKKPGSKKNSSSRSAGTVDDGMLDESVSSVEFSLESGFYDTDQQLELSAQGEGLTIRYTTDGSIPNESSPEYTEALTLTDRKNDFSTLAEHKDITASHDYSPPMTVDKGNVIRAAAFKSDGTHGKVTSRTIFVGIDRVKKYGDVPVISLMMDQADLFDYERGIYVLGKVHDDWLAEDPKNASADVWKQEANFTQRGKEWERPVYAEYILSDGTTAFTQDLGIRIMGAASRNEHQKSLRLSARKDYGAKNVKYELIPDNTRSDGQGNVEKYKSFVLRNGGNDCNFAKIRDPLLQSMVSDKTFETIQSTPVVVFIDGEYWGMYTLTEDYSDNYISNNYEIDNNNVVILKVGEIEEGNDEDIKLYSNMYEFITENDMSDADNYAKACDMLDMQTFSDYMAFNIYIANEDSIIQGNNWRMWRVRDADNATAVSDGKWRMMAYDTDYSSGIYTGGQNYDENFIKKAINGTQTFKDLDQPPAEIFRALLDNDDFKQMFILSLCDMRNISFEKSKVDAAYNDIVSVYSSLVKDTFKRFGPDYAKDGFEWNADGLKQFLDGRNKVFMTHITDVFKPGEKVSVTVKTSDSSKGGVILNTTALDLSDKDFSGEYYTAYPITVTADPASGKFVKWEATGCSISDANSPTATVTIKGDCEIKAIYE